ncbi:MAG: hypothetical protein FJW20_22460 [Acidimicrobiia bacterium]|nr:hypothetical protein [Acidimicrobiia bacterium]
MNQKSYDPLRASLKGLPRFSVPGSLHDSLRVMASRESLRRRRRVSAEAFFQHCRDVVVLWFHNLMRPVAVPFAGGLVSAVILFALMAPQFVIHRPVSGDVPTGLTTMAAPQFALLVDALEEDIVVDVVTDGEGRMVDYSIPAGQKWAQDAAMVRSIETTLMFTKFTPATMFGMPANGRTRIKLRRSHMMEVRG